MPKTFTSTKDTDKLLDVVIEELLRKGIKATTMDSLAATLQMSKRTLYEIFENKDNMIEAALKRFHNNFMITNTRILENSSNIMEAMLGWLTETRNWMSIANVDFLRDIDEFYSDEKRIKEKNCRFQALEQLLKRGAEEGYLRDDVNFPVQCRMLSIQMESLKRMEELFPPDITLLEAYDSITTGFLRSISSQKGLEMLDALNS